MVPNLTAVKIGEQNHVSKNAPKVAVYCRVSTNQQTTDNQSAELIQVAANRGWTIVSSYIDHGISGSKNHTERAALDQLLKDAKRGKFDTLMVWSIDRLGRSLQHLITLVNDSGQSALISTSISKRLIPARLPGSFAFPSLAPWLSTSVN